MLTQGSFYWLADRIRQPSVAGWWSNLHAWYGYFMCVTAGYVGLTALGHIAATRHAPVSVRTQIR